MSEVKQPPVASGDLARTPFAHLVLYLYQRRSSGTLLVRANSSEYRALFHGGRAVAALLPQPSTALDDALLPLTGLASGAFEFHESDRVGSGPGVVTGMFDPLAFVVRAARRHIRTEVVDGLLSKYKDLALALDPGVDLSRLALTADELRLLAILKRGALPCETLLAQCGLPSAAARRLLYSLLIVKAIRPDAPGGERDSHKVSAAGASPRPSTSSVQPRPSRPVGSRASSDAWRAIASAAGAIADGRPASDPGFRAARSSRPSVPGVQDPASSQRALSRPLSNGLSSRGRPPSRPLSRPLSEPLSQSPGLDSQPLLPHAARDSVSSGLRRARPSTPQPRVTPRPSLPDVDTLDADGKFRRVELLCQRNAYQDALPIMRALLEGDRKNAKYLGMLSQVLLGRVTDTNFGKELVDCVNQALRIDPDEIYALYTKARCYKRLGKEREALHYFRRTLAVDPTHLDAAREARLLVLRLNEKRKR